jgi:outer membrane receptor protein involved in Fe transport
MAVRAAVGAGFALAPLGYLATSDATYLCGPYYIEYVSNLNLKPETSVGFDVGTDIRMRHNTIMSIDFYGTNLYNQFFLSTQLSGTLAGLPLYTAEYGNLGKSRYEGINFDVRHDTPVGMYWHGALGLTRAYVVYVPPGFYDSPATGPNSVNTYVVPGINFNGESESPVPYTTAAAQIGYRWGPEKYIDLSPTYYGNGNPYFSPAFVEFDAHASYPLTKNIALLAIFRNISGIYDQSIQYRSPANVSGVPTIAGPLYPLLSLPYGPRTVIVTLNLRY